LKSCMISEMWEGSRNREGGTCVGT
jgi:hypothetical protein